MLNFSQTDFSQAEDIGGNELMPHGTVAKFKVSEVGAVRDNSNQKKFFTVTFEVAEGPFAGKQIKENYYMDGKDFALQKTKIFARYVLETTDNAHLNPERYKISHPKQLENKWVVAKVKVKGFFGDSGDWIYANEIDALATPRTDSSTFKIYKAYQDGDQPWASEWRPEVPKNTPHANSNSGHPALASASDIGF
jgi:hypothetical protein